MLRRESGEIEKFQKKSGVVRLELQSRGSKGEGGKHRLWSPAALAVRESRLPL